MTGKRSGRRAARPRPANTAQHQGANPAVKRTSRTAETQPNTTDWRTALEQLADQAIAAGEPVETERDGTVYTAIPDILRFDAIGPAIFALRSHVTQELIRPGGRKVYIFTGASS